MKWGCIDIRVSFYCGQLHSPLFGWLRVMDLFPRNATGRKIKLSIVNELSRSSSQIIFIYHAYKYNFNPLIFLVAFLFGDMPTALSSHPLYFHSLTFIGTCSVVLKIRRDAKIVPSLRSSSWTIAAFHFRNSGWCQFFRKQFEIFSSNFSLDYKVDAK